MNGMDPERPSEQGRAADGVVLAVLTVLMALLGALFPLPVWLVAPVPVAVLAYRHGYGLSVATAALAVLLVGWVEQQVFAGLAHVLPAAQLRYSLLGVMVAPVTLGLIGLVIGGAWREGISAGRTLWMAVLAAVLPGAATWLWVHLVHGVDLVAVFIDNSLLLARTLMEQAAQSAPAAEALADWRLMIESAERSFPLVRPFLPGTLVAAASCVAAVDMALTRAFLVRLGDDPPWFPPFARWRFPWPLALGFVAGQGLLLAGSAMGHAGLIIAGENMRVMFHLLFAAQGLAVGWYLLERRLPAVGRVLVLGLVFIVAPAVAAWTGVLDTWFNFRRLPPQPDGSRPEAGTGGET
ncbi:MAG: hypothetical protein BAA04_01565 [Firmicutes bacterium ZCTH02-B6]|nr:MAG: hypothetical protein BAA04_01565 [Firmicutes bacterium ZCTH02-B6]